MACVPRPRPSSRRCGSRRAGQRGAEGDGLSNALNYLLKDAGKHLDPKTRNLISVITKVDSQTERGFKQSLGRALREGCTPMEVLDALLMAFPKRFESGVVDGRIHAHW